MDVSHFELIFKPQAPVGVGGTGAVDTALQGYFLEISNLEDVEYQYELEFVAQPPGAGQPQRSLAGNTLVFVDSPGVNNAPTTLAGGIGDSVFGLASGFVRIAPRATALVGVVPSVFGASPLDPTPLDPNPAAGNFEVRGFVRLNLPALRVSRFFSRAQASAPVRVMVTPQNRTTYLRANGTLSDQTQASLPTATGGAVAFVTPEPSRFTFPFPFPLEAELEIPRIPPRQRPAALAALLADLDDAPASLKALNEALGALEVPLAIERRTMAARGAAKARPATAEPA
jgi:hypothetical protein